MNKRNIVTLFIVGIICIVILIGIYLIPNKKVDNSSKLVILEDYDIYSSVIENVNNYIDALKNSDEKKIYFLLDTNYIKVKRINKKNVMKKIDKIKEDVSFEGKEVYYFSIDNDKKIYYITGNLVNEDQKVIDSNYQMCLIIDYKTLLVSFYPLKDKSDIDYIVDIDISSNGYNSFKSKSGLSEENMCILYYRKVSNLINNDIDSLYNNMTDNIKNSYDISRFKNLVNKKYYKYNSSIQSCDIDIIDKKRVFTAIDKNNNIFKFYEDGVMKFKIEMNLN